MSLIQSKEFQQLLARTKALGGELEATEKRVGEMKRKIEGGEEDEEVAKAKAVNAKLQYRIEHLKTNLEEELEKDRRYIRVLHWSIVIWLSG